ncbi:MAG: IS66 family transposase [Pirellulaceae bacterium]
MKDLPRDIRELQALLLQTQEALHQAQHENTELSATIQSQRQKLEKQEQTIADLLSALRGKQRERIDPDQLLMFDLGELQQLAEEQAEPEPAPARRRQGHGRRRLPADLPREEVVHELPEQERLCPHDGRPMELIGYETSEQLEYIRARLKVLVHKRAKYACPIQARRSAGADPAAKPPQPIDKGLLGPSLLAAMVVGKFGDHLPGYRLEDILARQGVIIRRSTIYGCLAAAADLCLPLVALLKQRLLSSKVVHTDDTSVKLIDHDLHGTRTARFWAYVGDTTNPYTVYDFTETRQRDGPQTFLKGYRGYLQADAHGGYDGVYLASQGDIVEVACWAHCRRCWWKAREQDPPRAHHVLAVINRLYEVERAAANVEADERRRLRGEHAAPLLDDLERWLGEQALLPQSLIGKAQTYTRNQWTALRRYLEDGDLSIDNNVSERTVKPVAIGRNYAEFRAMRSCGRGFGGFASAAPATPHISITGFRGSPVIRRPSADGRSLERVRRFDPVRAASSADPPQRTDASSPGFHGQATRRLPSCRRPTAAGAWPSYGGACAARPPCRGAMDNALRLWKRSPAIGPRRRSEIGEVHAGWGTAARPDRQRLP